MRTRCHSAPHSIHFARHPSPTLSARFLERFASQHASSPGQRPFLWVLPPFFISSCASPRALGVCTQYSYHRLRSLRCLFHQGRRDTFPFLTSPFRVGRIISGALISIIRHRHQHQYHHLILNTTSLSNHGYQGCSHALNARVQDNAEGAHALHCRSPMRDQHTRVCPPLPPSPIVTTYWSGVAWT